MIEFQAFETIKDLNDYLFYNTKHEVISIQFKVSTKHHIMYFKKP